MRKINLILANAAIAAALLLSSCKKDEDETTAAVGPTVNLLNVKKAGDIDPTFKDSEIVAGTKISFRVQATKGDKNLKTVGITLNGTTIGKADLTVDWKPATENPIKVSNNNVDITIDLTIPANATSSKYVITATDNDGLTASKAVTITEPVTTTDLASSVAYTWERTGGTATGLSALGLKWTSNTATNAIVTKDAATKLVKLTDTYASITTVEDLKTKVDAATAITQYDEVSVSAASMSYTDVLGVVSGGKYFVIEVKSSSVKSNGTGSASTIKINGNYKTEPISKQ